MGFHRLRSYRVGVIPLRVGRAHCHVAAMFWLQNRVLVGGELPEGPGFFYPPTVIDQITSDMRITMEEAFGPLASVYRISSQDEAIAVANQTTFGLSAAMWSNDLDEQDFFMRELDAGAVFINGMTISYPELPFGGIKDSGFGRELGAPGIREFTNMKTVWRG